MKEQMLIIPIPEEQTLCPKCDAIMAQVHEGETRVILGQLVTLLGRPLGYTRCVECGYTNTPPYCPSCGEIGLKLHPPDGISPTEYGLCPKCHRSCGVDVYGTATKRWWQ